MQYPSADPIRPNKIVDNPVFGSQIKSRAEPASSPLRTDLERATRLGRSEPDRGHRSEGQDMLNGTQPVAGEGV